MSYQGALEQERAESGLGKEVSEEEGQLSLASLDTESEAANKKTNIVRDFILSRGQEGVRIRDLQKFLQERGLDNNPTFPYSVTNRLLKRGELAVSAGRFIATEKMRARLEAQR